MALATAHLDSSSIKSTGAHYTPVVLAKFLAGETAKLIDHEQSPPITILDPACGDGGLLKAITLALPESMRGRLVLKGYETDTVALEKAAQSLELLGVKSIRLKHTSFIDYVAGQEWSSSPLFDSMHAVEDLNDVVISNPPYVRTQVIGTERSRELASAFGLTGRLDLYHAFVVAITKVLRDGGVLGLLTSNKFMFNQSGMSVRRLLRRSYNLKALFDLGDTKFFSAAVLPSILIARRTLTWTDDSQCSYTRVYETKTEDKVEATNTHSILDSLNKSEKGVVRTREGTFAIERGVLDRDHDAGSVWRLSSSNSRAWLATVSRHRQFSFGDIATVRVGIKTTADSIFIRDDWDSLPDAVKPETSLLRPLITHHSASRWNFRNLAELPKKVLFTHTNDESTGRRPIDLQSFPKARAYLESHRRRLEARKYVLDAGRRWYEIWVPQNPSDWLKAKIVFPDISKGPRFALDDSRVCIVNGDCYWITLKPGVPDEWLLTLLAVANSSFITKYYDLVFHNKLYSGRRRFMTQYVREFPLPKLSAGDMRRITDLVSQLTDNECEPETEMEVDELVWSLFGMAKEPSW